MRNIRIANKMLLIISQSNHYQDHTFTYQTNIVLGQNRFKAYSTHHKP